MGAPPPFDDLEAIANGWWPLGAIRELWAAHDYELSRAVQSNGKPIAIIAIRLPTSLIAPKLHRALGQILIVAECAIALSLIGALFFGGLVLRPLAAITSGVEQMTVVKLLLVGLAAVREQAQLFHRLIAEPLRLVHHDHDTLAGA